jgi:hypothetical protein
MEVDISSKTGKKDSLTGYVFYTNPDSPSPAKTDTFTTDPKREGKKVPLSKWKKLIWSSVF